MFHANRYGWGALLATMMFSACAVEVAEGPDSELDSEVDEDSAIEPVESALSSPQKFYAVRTSLSGSSHVPSSDFRTNVVEIVRGGVGSYGVLLNDSFIDAPIPNTAMVVAIGGGIARCKFAGWAGAGANLDIMAVVTCHNGNTGDPADSRFVFTAFTAGSGITGRAAGGRVSETGAVSNTFNTRGAVGAVRTGEGTYTVLLTGLGVPQRGGTVQVTAEGFEDASHCKVVSWFPDASGFDALNVNVKCFADASDDPGDSAFHFLYDEEIPARNNRGAYAWANNATSEAVYQPNRTYTFTRGPGLSDSTTNASASRFPGAAEAGHYKMVYTGTLEENVKKSYAFVGAYGDGDEYCKLVSYDIVAGCTVGCDVEVQTQCYRRGQRMNSRYVQTWASANALLVQ